MAVSKRLRMEVFRRDDHTCRYCGARAPEVTVTVDHVTPVALGGRDEPSNLVTACKDCNAGKSSVDPGSERVEDVRADALRWAAAMRLAADEQLCESYRLSDLCQIVEEAWEAWNPRGYPIALPPGWRESIAQFARAGLTERELLEDAVVSTLNKSHIAAGGLWRYFCGTAWGMLKDRQDRARAIIDYGEAQGAAGPPARSDLSLARVAGRYHALCSSLEGTSIELLDICDGLCLSDPEMSSEQWYREFYEEFYRCRGEEYEWLG